MRAPGGEKSVSASFRARRWIGPHCDGCAGAAKARLRDYRYWYDELYELMKEGRTRLEARRPHPTHQFGLAVLTRDTLQPLRARVRPARQSARLEASWAKQDAGESVPASRLGDQAGRDLYEITPIG